VDVVVARINVGLAGSVGSGVGGISVEMAVAGGSVPKGDDIGIGVVAGAQALSDNTNTISKLNNTDQRDLILFS
jgi:hypothetical protein